MKEYSYVGPLFGDKWAIHKGNKFLYWVDSKKQAQDECRRNNKLAQQLEAAE